ncbi:MAG: class I SAM-dependent methyltransferase [Pseudomonadota bacterium]
MWQLVQTEKRLELHVPELGGPIYVDFVDGAVAHRRRYGGGQRQPLARAVGIRSQACPTILDATAGLGRDAFVLATFGCHVTLCERSPTVAALLADGLKRAAEAAATADIIERMMLIEQDSLQWLKANDTPPEVVYLDPMYPERQKSALVKKEMRALRQVAGDDEDAVTLLETARQYALKRVVVKRPAHAPTLGSSQPDTVISGKTTRFDVYLT